MKEDYQNVKQLIIKMNNARFEWYASEHFKIPEFLLSLPCGYFCFLCLWSGRADGEHYKNIHLPTRNELTLGMHNVIREPLVSRGKVLLPPIHIKLGLVKQFVKALNFEAEVFQEICSMFSSLSDAKIKIGIIPWSPDMHNIKL